MNGDSYFHVGMIVPGLEEAQAALTELVGLTWRSTIEAPVPVHTAATGTTETVQLRFAYSEQQPCLELIEAVPGTVWGLSEGSNLHHLGFWTDDLRRESSRLDAARCPLEACMDLGDGQRPTSFGYHTGLGIRVELVDRANEAFLFGEPSPSSTR